MKVANRRCELLVCTLTAQDATTRGCVTEGSSEEGLTELRIRRSVAILFADVRDITQ